MTVTLTVMVSMCTCSVLNGNAFLLKVLHIFLDGGLNASFSSLPWEMLQNCSATSPVLAVEFTALYVKTSNHFIVSAGLAHCVTHEPKVYVVVLWGVTRI